MNINGTNNCANNINSSQNNTNRRVRLEMHAT